MLSSQISSPTRLSLPSQKLSRRSLIVEVRGQADSVACEFLKFKSSFKAGRGILVMNVRTPRRFPDEVKINCG